MDAVIRQLIHFLARLAIKTVKMFLGHQIFFVMLTGFSRDIFIQAAGIKLFRVVADLSWINDKALDWKPNTNVPDGVGEMINWIENHRSKIQSVLKKRTS